MSEHTLIRGCMALVSGQFVMTIGILIVLRRVRSDVKASRTLSAMLLDAFIDWFEVKERTKKTYQEGRP